MNRVKVAKAMYVIGTGAAMTARIVAWEDSMIRTALYASSAGAYMFGAKLLSDEMTERVNKAIRRQTEDIIDVECIVIEGA